jgi:peroxin-5
MSSQRDELETDYGTSMQQAWENGLGDLSSDTAHGDRLEFDDEGIPMLDPYVFGQYYVSSQRRCLNSFSAEKNNRYVDESPARSLLDEAKALLELNGSLSEAALMLEAAIQKDQLGEGGYEAWVLLGETRNMDEREEAGMKALTEGVKRAERNGTPGPGMMVRGKFNFTSIFSDARIVTGHFIHE